MTRQWTPEQQAIIESFGQSQAVVAGAGCGKTTTLVGKCMRLLEQNPKARFCVVSFTEKSIREFKHNISLEMNARGMKYDSAKYWVRTFHGLCGSVIREFPREAGLDGGESILDDSESDRIWRQALDVLWASDQSKELSEAIDTIMADRRRSNVEELLARLQSLRPFGALERFEESDSPAVQALLRCYESVSTRFANLKRRAGALDFSDLEILAEKALQSKRVADTYRRDFDLVLVDEFQDTNPIQGRILKLFCRENLSNVCVVGDPKQSIYRFRDADVSVFEDFISSVSKKQLLSSNYRSVPEILNYVNEVCAPIFEASQMEYDPLVPARASGEGARVVRWQTESPQHLAAMVLQLKKTAQDLGGLVVLSRKTTGKLIEFLRCLKENKVPFVIGGTGRYWEDPRVVELVSFLQGWFQLDQTLAQATFLRAPMIQVADATLYTWGQNLFENFFASEHPVAQHLRDEWQQRFRIRPGQVLEKLLYWDALPAEMELPLLSLWHKCEEASTAGLRSEEVVQDLKNNVENAERESEVPLPSLDATIRVMTVHASKGLQFPNVLLFDFFDLAFRGRADTTSLFWDRNRGAFLAHRDESGGVDKEDPKNLEWKEVEARHKVAESKRLFYVALTRAQEKLIFAWFPKKEKESKDDPLVKDYWRAWLDKTRIPELESEPTLIAPKAGESAVHREYTAPIARPQNAIPYRPRHSASEWMQLKNCPRRYTWQTVLRKPADVAATDREEVTNDSSETVKLRPADEVGKELHRHLELEEWSALRKDYAAFISSSGQLYRLPMVARELGFEVPLSEEEACVGVMDRLEWDADQKKVWIVDYKWTRKDATAEELAGRYRLQLEVYAWAALNMLERDPEQRKTWALKASLFHFGPKGACEIKVESLKYSEIVEKIQKIWIQSKHLIQSPTEAVALPGLSCRFCSYQTSCDQFIVD